MKYTFKGAHYDQMLFIVSVVIGIIFIIATIFEIVTSYKNQENILPLIMRMFFILFVLIIIVPFVLNQYKNVFFEYRITEQHFSASDRFIPFAKFDEITIEFIDVKHLSIDFNFFTRPSIKTAKFIMKDGNDQSIKIPKQIEFELRKYYKKSRKRYSNS